MLQSVGAVCCSAQSIPVRPGDTTGPPRITATTVVPNVIDTPRSAGMRPVAVALHTP